MVAAAPAAQAVVGLHFAHNGFGNLLLIGPPHCLLAAVRHHPPGGGPQCATDTVHPAEPCCPGCTQVCGLVSLLWLAVALQLTVITPVLWVVLASAASAASTVLLHQAVCKSFRFLSAGPPQPALLLASPRRSTPVLPAKVFHTSIGVLSASLLCGWYRAASDMDTRRRAGRCTAGSDRGAPANQGTSGEHSTRSRLSLVRGTTVLACYR